MRVRWKPCPDPHDFEAAFDFLDLMFVPEHADRIVEALRDAPMVAKKAKDILRAASLPLLSADDSEVAAVLEKIRDKRPVSPILLARSPLGHLIVADGYHRVCAAYHLSDDTEVHAHLA